MARTLEQLQKQYNSTASKGNNNTGKPHGGPGGPGGPGGRGRRMSGKPKDMGKTIGRILS